MNISYSFGIIDLFHYGHLCALQKASENADIHVFGLVSDEAATAWQGSIVSSEEERSAVVESIRCVDKVMLQKTFDPTENIKILHNTYPDAHIVLYHGSDMAVLPAELYLKSIGGEVEIVDYYEKLSPQNIYEVLSNDKDKSPERNNIISTKANTLIALKSRLKESVIEDIYVCTVGEFRSKPEAVFQEIYSRFAGEKIVVRSSSRSEDCFTTSNAGHYESVLNISSSDYQSVLHALEEVSMSYEKDVDTVDQEQILVQRQTMDVVCSGVVFTKDIQNNRPYYVINYDDAGRTDTVTSGAGGKSVWIARDADETDIPAQWVELMRSVKEIESILFGVMLDIEFAIKSDGTVVVFQTRPLAANYKYNKAGNDQKILSLKNDIADEYRGFINDKRYLLSDMAFWNPAEIIGTNPYPLDYSLYRKIITHRAWNKGLVEMGYKEVPDDLMFRFGNKPYICVDYSFKSLIPAVIGQPLEDKLISLYRDKLSRDYTAHDKIEFEIVFSCFDFETDEKISDLRDHGFSDEEIFEIRRALHDLTYRCIRNYPETLKHDLADLDILESVRIDVERQLKDKPFDVHTAAYQCERLLAAIERYGTPQFSRQARCAFIAKALCRSLVSKGYISEAEHDTFMSDIVTVAKQFEKDYHSLRCGEISIDEFNEIYGHLRAGTYDIRSPRYDAMDLMAGMPGNANKNECSDDITLPKGRIEKALQAAGMTIRSEELEEFIRGAIEQREYFKFIFTRSLSRVIEIIAEIGKTLGFERNEMSYLEVAQIMSLQFFDNEIDMSDYIEAIIETHQRRHTENQSVVLPEVITEARDLNVVHIAESRPNFVTLKSVHAKTAILENDFSIDLMGKIVVVEKADPGYDWIFARGIVGLVTKYGGAASHMAIRCAEFGIPAAIGCGEKIYSYVKNNVELTLDCQGGRIIGGAL